ncbi:MAG: ring-opening amidohydrolase [Alphaproteobacteria bacterium]|nr:ring-opening amidohydrolase [Alphaproteobacteria bacterium]MCB9930278.1 ring-opening amidohydrolase [Alphaproteobacteria bacterium]
MSASPRRASIHRLPMAGPDDTSAIAAGIAAGRIVPAAVVAILGKTEGNGCVNDFTRGYATQSLRRLLAAHLPPERVEQVCLVMSGGTEGALSPHWLVIEAREDAGPVLAGDEPALAVGHAMTRPLAPEEIGRRAQVELVAEAVTQAIANAGIETPADVHFVQIKCPLLTSARIADAEARGETVATRETLKSMGLSRGAAALGVAVALGELPLDRIADTAIGRDRSLASARASCSAGVELMANEVVVLGQSPAWTGPLRIGHAVMGDALDIAPVVSLMRSLHLADPFGSGAQPLARPVALLAKAEASASGEVRGWRHTMLNDSDLSSTRHARAFVGGALAALLGETPLFVSGGAEHQGPDGGGPVAIIAERLCP